MNAEPEQLTLLAVHAHPDDETITIGGTLARYAAEGVRTIVVTCTRGDVGGVSDPSLTEASPLGGVRERELEEAARILGVSRLVQLGYRDSGMAGTPENSDPACFFQADPEMAIAQVVRVIREERPQVVVVYDEQGGYGHPDHVRAHQVGTAAFHAAGDPSRFTEAGPPWAPSKLYQVIFPRTWAGAFVRALREAGIDAPPSAPAGADAGPNAPPFGSPDELVTTFINVLEYAETKRCALTAHRTQMGPDQFFMRMPPDLGRRFWAVEYFRLVGGPPALGIEQDLFAGLRAS